MVELFDILKHQKKNTIRIRCERLSAYSAAQNPVQSLLKEIEDKPRLYDVRTMELDTEIDIFDDLVIRGFNIEFSVDDDTYEYIHLHYGDIIEKYNRYNIDLSDIRYSNLFRDLGVQRIVH